MRIAIIGTRGYPYVYSGYETFVAHLSVMLMQRGHEVTVYCHRGLFPEKPPQVNGVSLVYLPAIESKVLSQLTHSLLSTLHVLFSRTDVVLFVNSANGPFGILTRLWGKRTAINVDGLEWLRPKWKGVGRIYFHWASKLATKFFDAVITDSDRMADVYSDEFGSQTITIAYGADVAVSKRPEVIEQFGLTQGDYYLVVGRLIPDNNADLIVKSFIETRIRRKLVILGDVPYKDLYASQVRATRDSRIVFPGYVRDQNVLMELYCNAYAYIHGHEFGGTNPALLKALACGCCVIALDTPFSREVMNNTEYGLYFRKNVPDFKRILWEVENNAQTVQRYQSRARNRITAAYSWEKITDQYETLFKSLLTRPS